MQRWELLIDEAAAKCGSQNALARRIGITGPNMSQARNGKRRLTTAQLESVAEILGVGAADLWLAQEDYRNPFRVIETALVALMSGLLLFTLPSESQAMARVSDQSAAVDHAVDVTDPAYIVMHLCDGNQPLLAVVGRLLDSALHGCSACLCQRR